MNNAEKTSFLSLPSIPLLPSNCLGLFTMPLPTMTTQPMSTIQPPDTITHQSHLTQSSTNISLTPEQFERLYLAPKVPHAADHAAKFANAVPLGFLGCVFSVPASNCHKSNRTISQIRNLDIHVQYGTYGMGRCLWSRCRCWNIFLHWPRSVTSFHHLPLDTSPILLHDGMWTILRLLAILWHASVTESRARWCLCRR